MKPILLSLLVCVACKHASSSSSTSHSETQTTTDTTSSESGSQTTVTTTSEAPSTTTTTVREYAPPQKEEPGSSEDSEARPQGVRLEPPASANAGLPRNVPRRGPLVKETVTVTQRGAETTETHQQASTQAQGTTETHAQAQGDTKTQAQSASAPSAGCIGASWIWGLAVLVGVIGLLYGVIKFRRAVP